MKKLNIAPVAKHDSQDTLRCRIAWEYRDKSKNGHGEPVFTFEEAAEFAEYMNKQVPRILHWVEPCFFKL